MSIKSLVIFLSSCLLSCNIMSNKNKVQIANAGEPPTDCSVCYFMGASYSVGAASPSGTQKCVLGSNGKGAIWVNNNANVTEATCLYCILGGAWYSEGALNGATNPVQYCRSGSWK